MEIIEKEKIVEQPEGYGPNKRDINGKANAGLTLGIIGTALGAWALFGNRRTGLLGGGLGSGLGGANININGVETGSSGLNQPTAFMAWQKECNDTVELQKGMYKWALTQQSQRFSDRQTIDSEMFGLYKTTRDGFDIVNANHNRDAFNLYKSQRDGDDAILKELSDLKSQVAINAAIRPYQDKLIQCEIDRAFTAGINYVDRKTCNVVYGQVCLPNEPVVTGYVGATQCGCPRVITTPTTPAS
jgi:hypothetical protein